MTLGQGMYKLQTSQCTGNFEKELKDYHFHLHIACPKMDLYGHVRKALGLGFAHLHHIENFWGDCQDYREVRARHYMWMTANFVRKVQRFPIPDQVKEDDSTIMDPRYPRSC